jgi:hypothetical protein
MEMATDGTTSTADTEISTPSREAMPSPNPNSINKSAAYIMPVPPAVEQNHAGTRTQLMACNTKLTNSTA